MAVVASAEDAAKNAEDVSNMDKSKTTGSKVSVLAGLVIALIAFIVSVGTVSYLFSWRQDQSLLDPIFLFDDTYKFANEGSAIGALTGEFLVRDCFGVAALVLVGVLVVLAVKLILRRIFNWVNLSVIGIAGTFELSLLLAYAAPFFDGASGVFGGGLGGASSSFLVGKLISLTGQIPALLIILVLVAATVVLLLPSSFFAEKSADSLVSDLETAEETADIEPAVEPDTVAVIEPVTDVEPVADFEPVAEIEPVVEVEPAGIVNAVDFEGDSVDLQITGPAEALSTTIEEELPQLDIHDELGRYRFPSLDLLKDYADKRFNIPQDEIERNVMKIKNTLASFKIPITNIDASVGYTVTLYKINLGEGVRVGQVKNLEDDIAIKIGIKGVRVVMLSDAVGIEVPNDTPSVVPLKAILNSDAFRSCHSELPVALGYTITTKAKVFDLSDAPHLLVAGATKQGKSVGLNAIIASLLYCKHPTELKFVFVDPKMVEFSQYSKLYKHYLAVLPTAESDEDEAASAIVKDPKSAEAVLRSLCIEMDERYKLLAAAGVNKITDYNEKYRNRHLNPEKGHKFLPYLVVVIDEYADLTKSTFGSDRNLSRSIENSIIRLAAKGRAAGLHVIIATQRPSVDVITGTIKSNFPTRLAFRTASRQDSQTILGITGAERLIGKGDMLYFSGADAERLQCALISSGEIDALTSFIAGQTGFRQCYSAPYYLPDPGDPEGGEGGSEGGLVDMKNLDPLFEEAARLAVLNRAVSTSMIQRKMQLGFARAGRIMDQLEAAGVVGPSQGSKPREALVPDLATLQGILDAYMK